MALKGDPVKPNPLSQEYIVESDDSDQDQNKRTNGAQSKAFRKNISQTPKNVKQSKLAKRQDSRLTEESTEEPDELSEDDHDRGSEEQEGDHDAEAEARDEEDEDEESDDDSQDSDQQDDIKKAVAPSKSAAGKRRGDSTHATDDRAMKKTKFIPQVPIAIAAKPFLPPKGFDRVGLSGTNRASPAFLSGQGEKQLWYFTAPSSVSIDSLGSLDMEAVMNGQPVVNQGGNPYVLVPHHRTSERLLVTEGNGGNYVANQATISRIFHLRHVSAPNATGNQSISSKATIPNFTATAEGGKKPVRQQPEGLRMRYYPFGSGGHPVQQFTPPPENYIRSSNVSQFPDETIQETPRQSKKGKKGAKQATAAGEIGEASTSTNPKPANAIEANTKSPQTWSPVISHSSDGKQKKKKKKRKSGLGDEPDV